MKIKRLFDFILAVISLLVLAPLVFISWLTASIDTQSNGLFLQKRVGRYGQLFTIFKIRTMHPQTRKISRIGDFLRKSKMDELPQLLNILLGDMSFVGPRPDVAGYADQLKGADRIILKVRPGVTGLASLKYRNEEYLLAKQSNPLEYNDTVIWPDKVKINKWYVEHRTWWMDVQILFYTLVPVGFDVEGFMVEEGSSPQPSPKEREL